MSFTLALATRRRRRRAGLLLAALAVTGATGLVVVSGMAAGLSTTALSSEQTVACPVAGINLGQLQLTAEQSANATTIVTVGRQQNLPTKAQVTAIAAALQESSLRNLAAGQGDRDSIGLFQMRPSQGWGTPAQLHDPAWSAGKFYTVLTGITNWQNLSVNDAAQAVLRSDYPLAYGPHEQEASQIVAAVAGAAPTDCTASESIPSGPVGLMLQAALAQQGKPYVWGATGPDSFDCSGLVVYAWRQAGYQLHVRTSEEMYNLALPVPAGQEQPGDLIFSQFGENGQPGPGHVQIVVTRGTLVEAPRTGLNVREAPYGYKGHITFGRLPASAMSLIR